MSSTPYQIEALMRGLQVMSLFTRETPTMSLTEIKNASNLNKTRAFRIASTLQTAGYLERDPETKRYRPGLKVLQLGFEAISSLEVRQVARPYLQHLAQEAGRTVSLGVLDGTEIVYIDRVRVKQVFGVVLGLGSRIPSHCASLGKALLAFLSPEKLAKQLDENNLHSYTSNTLTDSFALKADLKIVRLRGYSINDEEWVLGLRSIAAPVFDHTGAPVGAINISVSAAEVSLEELEIRFSEPVRTTARKISCALGFMPV